MSQCVPRWDLDDEPSKLSFRSHSNATAQDAPMVDDYEVAELTWENGQIALHALGPPRIPAKLIASESLSTKHTWEKTRTCDTLESLVNQATCLPLGREPPPQVNDELVPWFDRNEATVSMNMNMDALVPGSNRTKQDRNSTPVMDSLPGLGDTRGVGCSTHVGSCSGPYATQDEDVLLTAEKRSRVARVPAAPEWSSRDQSASLSATLGRDSHLHMAMDARERGMIAAGLTPTTSLCSHENTSSGKPSTYATSVPDENDSVSLTRPQEAGDEEIKRKGKGKSSVSTKRCRAAAIHNQSERKRRDKINQKMKTLQKLVPNSSKTDKASMLDEVIEYLKQLQAQVQMMNRMNMQPMMLPMAMQQQLQMAMMAPLGMSMGMGMGVGVMDMNSMGRPNISAMPPILHPAAFMPMASWDGSSHDRFPAVSTNSMPDPLSACLAFQQQPMAMEAYSRMAAALYQQLQQQPPSSNSKS